MKIFSSNQIREIDRYTVEHEPVSSVDLMERAARRLFEWIVSRHDKQRRFIVFAGPGNNGGDGLALGRMLAVTGYRVEIYYVCITDKESGDWKVNYERIRNSDSCAFFRIESADQFPLLLSDDVIVDAIFGSGLNHLPDGLAASVIAKINDSGCEVISIDIPSGMQGEDITGSETGNTVKASVTLSFQFPKLSFMFADSYPYTGDWFILPIGLHPEAIARTETPYNYYTESDILPLLRKRGKFDHKGTYGHGLLVAGSSAKAGAAVLAAKAALRTGAGLVTCHLPSSCGHVIQTALPEAMISKDKNGEIITEAPDTENYSAVAFGPGAGTERETAVAFHSLIKSCSRPLVIDADGLNILAAENKWLSQLKKGTILTPHPGEFERIAGRSSRGYERLQLQVSLSVRHEIIIVLKGAHTSVTTPEGKVYFNSTGNPGMATAGSGDVLTGIILSLLAQGYKPANAAVLGVYLHGLAGDIAVKNIAPESLIASDLTDNLSRAYNYLREK